MLRLLWLPALLLAGSCCSSTIARAQSSGEEAAFEAAFDRGFRLQKQGRFQEAILQYEVALEKLPRVMNAPDSDNLLNNLADLYRGADRFDEAERLYQFALKLRTERLGATDPSTMRTQAGLALLSTSRNDWDTGAKRYADLIELQTTVYGRESAQVADSLDSLGSIRLAQGRFEEAEISLLESIRIYEKVLRPKSPELLIPLCSMAVVQSDLGRPQQAERLLTRAIALAEGIKDDNTRLMQLGVIYLTMSEVNLRGGRYAQAEAAYLALLEIDAQVPSLRQALASVSVDLGNLDRHMGLLDKAEATLRESMEFASKFGVNSPDYRMLLASAWGRVYHARQAYPEAEKMLLLARDLSVQLYGPDHMTTATMLGSLGLKPAYPEASGGEEE